MYCHFLLASVLASGAQAFAPVTIKLSSPHAKQFVLGAPPLPNGAARIPQKLKIWDEQSKPSPSENPYFVVKPDKTIEWESTGFCVEAVDNEIGVSHCTGSPTQLWNFLPFSNGRLNQIQLSGSDKCIDVIGNGADLNGAPVVLRKCDSQVTASWTVEPLPLPTSMPQQITSFPVARAAPFVFWALLGALSLSGWRHWQGMTWWQSRAVAVRGGDVPLSGRHDHGGIALRQAVAMDAENMMAPAAMVVSPVHVEDDDAQKESATNITRRNMLAACLSAPVLMNLPAEVSAAAYPTEFGIITVADARAKELGIRQGVLVYRVQPGTSAAKAGILGSAGPGKLGDIILKVGKTAVNSNADLDKALSSYLVGAEVPVSIARLEDKEGNITEVAKELMMKAVLARSALQDI